ncbi:MAG: Fe-S cluster assembly protein HesB [Acidimicrobiia bacterium]|nr:Fe-S cluster assembly protein HesB [Acidimicrobiia bacterium]MBT8192695.1 Fe-S cluster assembly protein HesB [Acidimicrobiia bacterium]MBT8248123.1 Fe-S cluster assembly protein HesB [Acidimicrobiia bacterium]NNJ48218.1 Fe-S cluster assembly protein HesB [Acidimicrobiia bacterium]NNL13227.1 Fe-S cluster assembly protein HesB [Acidimicrobiia bacterium]
MTIKSLPWTGDDAADRLLAESPLALMLGMLLDQQVKMEWAFRAPYLLQERLGTELDAPSIAAMDPEEFVGHFVEKPALHRFPGSMGKRAFALCEAITEDYDGRPEKIWQEAADGADFYKRLKALPGFGEAKARIFVAIVGRRLGEGPDGWEEQAADWASIADVDTHEKIEDIREAKRLAKEKATPPA